MTLAELEAIRERYAGVSPKLHIWQDVRALLSHISKLEKVVEAVRDYVVPRWPEEGPADCTDMIDALAALDEEGG